MKAKSYLLSSLFLFGGIITTYAQCAISAGNDSSVVCGDSVRITAEPNWSVGLDNVPENLHSVFFTDDLNGYSVGENGSIRKTTDGGNTWGSQTSPVSGSLRSLFFVNATNGVAVGDGGKIINTNDGGSIWAEQISGTSEDLKAIYGTDLNTRIVVGSAGTILKTIDGGVTWTAKISPLSTDLISVFFSGANTGYISDGTNVLKTMDAGDTWAIISSAGGGKLHFTDNDTGYSAGNTTLYKTIDGGANWDPVLTSSTALSSIYFTDAQTGYAGSADKIYKTKNGGISWTAEVISGMTIESIYFPTSKIGYATGPLSGNGNKTIKYMIPDFFSWTPATGLTDANISNPFANPLVTTVYKITTTSGACTAIDSVKITVNPLTVDAGADKTLTCGGSVQLDNVTSSYNGNLTYSWTPSTGLSAANIKDPVVTVTQPTKYYLTVTTPNGCTATDSIMVLISPFIADAGSDKIVTCGNSVQLDQVTSNYTGAGNLIYSWFPATGLNSTSIPNPTATIKETTKYFVTVTTPNGCTSIDSTTVYVGPLNVDAGVNKTLVCGENSTLSITTNYNGSSALTYKWLPVTGLSLSTIANPVANPVQTTQYFVTITTPNGCVATDSVTVTVNPLTVNAGPDQTIICGGSAQLGAVTNYNGTTALNYLWSPATGLSLSNIPNPISSVAQTTETVVRVTAFNGCQAFDTIHVIVNPLVAEAGPDITLVCGGTKQLEVTSNYTGTGTLNYVWTPAAGLNLSNIAKPITSVTKTTKFLASVKTINGCIATDSITIFVDPLTVNAGIDKTHICGGSVALDSAITNYTGTNPLTYTWLPKTGLNDPSIPNPVSSGVLTYTLTISASFGECKATDNVKVSIAPLSSEEICIVTVDSTSKNIIGWNRQNLTLVDSFLIYRETTVPGNFVRVGSVPKNLKMYRDLTSKPDAGAARYKIAVKDSCGVESALSTVAHKTMYLSISKGTGNSWDLAWDNYEGFSVTSYAIYRGTDPKNLQYLDAVSGSVNTYVDSNPPTVDVYYQLEVINLTPCNPSISAVRSNIATSSPVGINELSNKLNFSVYPNPANDVVTINFENGISSNMTLTIYNSIGAAVKMMTLNQNQQQINVSDLSNGLYMVELKSTNGISKRKLTIQK